MTKTRLSRCIVERGLARDIEALKKHLEDEIARSLRGLHRSAFGTRQRSFEAAWRETAESYRRKLAFDRVVCAAGDSSRPPTYLVSSDFLSEVGAFLTRTSDEGLVYVTGPEHDDRVYALTRFVTLKTQSSIAHASPDPASQLQALSELDARGERWLAMFHSHPGSGAGATKPSSMDLETQSRLEKAGYPVIGAVFSRDGHVRFYARQRPFEVAVSGNGSQRIGKRLFRITKTLAAGSSTEATQ